MLLGKNRFFNEILKNIVNAVESKTLDVKEVIQLQQDGRRQQELTDIASKIIHYKHKLDLVNEAFDYVSEFFPQIPKNKEFQNDFLYVIDEFLSLIVYAVVSDLKSPDSYFENYLENLKVKYICDDLTDAYITAIEYMKKRLIEQISFSSLEEAIYQISKYFDFLLKGIL